MLGPYIAIVGSRNWPGVPEEIHARVRAIGHKHPNVVIVSGHGGKVDIAAEEEAKRARMNYFILPAKWDTHGRAAGFDRNSDIAEIADIIVAFWDGVSSGTRDTMVKGLAKGKQVYRVLRKQQGFGQTKYYLQRVESEDELGVSP